MEVYVLDADFADFYFSVVAGSFLCLNAGCGKMHLACEYADKLLAGIAQRLQMDAGNNVD